MKSILKKAELNKRSSIGGMAAMAAGGHLVANTGVKALVDAGDATRKKGLILPYTRFDRWAGKKFKDFQAKQTHQAIKRGITGKARPISQSLIENWVAPEATLGAHIGSKLGDSLRHMSPGKRKRALKKLRMELALNPELRRKSPAMQSAFSGINRLLTEGLPSKGAVQKPRIGREIAANLGVGAVAAAAKPSAFGHFLTNKSRVLLAKSEIGKRTNKSQAKSGILIALGKKKKGKLGNWLTDTLVSPAIRDPSKITETLTETAIKNPKRMAKLYGALSKFAPKATKDKAMQHAQNNQGEALKYIQDILGPKKL